MSDKEANIWGSVCLVVLILIAGQRQLAAGSTPETDREVILQLKQFLISQNNVNQGPYLKWNQTSTNPCDWPEITCTEGRVTGVDLSESGISGGVFGNFSALSELSVLDLSENTIGGVIPYDLNGCSKLKYLNLSHNIIEGELKLNGLINLEIVDLTSNRLTGDIRRNFPAICDKLISLYISSNWFTGRLDNCFDECTELQYLDLSSNGFIGNLWLGFPRLEEFSVLGNNLTGELPSFIFTQGCNLKVMDLSENHFFGEIPREITNCGSLSSLLLWGNNFTGQIPTEFGSLSNLTVLLLGNNKFSRELPESLLNCSKLFTLDMSGNAFGGDVQDIFGKMVHIKSLLLHGNSYTGGIYSSGIQQLMSLRWLDLSFNNFTGELPVELSNMNSLRLLILAHNQLTGKIPLEFGNLSGLQALDLSYNKLSGTIPPTIGNISSLLWLMLANNSLIGAIPPEVGNCRSLLWLNLANNQLSGKFPPQLSKIGLNATPTFELNRQNNEVEGGYGECLAMQRWLPADYPPFSFVYAHLTRKSCRNLWNQLLKGHGIFPVCIGGSSVRTLQISGFVQLSGNRLTGEIPPEIGNMQNFSMLHLGMNSLSGNLQPNIQRMPLTVLNISFNNFSGQLPSDIGNMNCLQNLDLSFNNFSGAFPFSSLDRLSDLSRFSVSFNPFISGVIPTTGQLATFDHGSYLGNPLLTDPSESIPNNKDEGPNEEMKPEEKTKMPDSAYYGFVCGLVSSYLIFGGIYYIRLFALLGSRL